jgi:hypothetical protein
MSFKANGALFRQTTEQLQQRLGDRFDPSKNYPEMDGVLNVTREQVDALVHYLMNAEPQGERQEIPVRISGWTKVANSGKKYVSLSFQPDNKVLKQIEERNAAAAPAQQAATANAAAQSVAGAFQGSVIDDGDIPF